MIVPPDRAPRGFEALAYRVVHHLVGNNDVATLAEAWDYARDGREGVGVHDGALGAEKRGDVGLGLHVNVLRAVELRGAAGAHAIGAQGLDSLFFYRFAGVEVVEVVRCEIGHSPAVRELDLGARWSVHQMWSAS